MVQELSVPFLHLLFIFASFFYAWACRVSFDTRAPVLQIFQILLHAPQLLPHFGSIYLVTAASGIGLIGHATVDAVHSIYVVTSILN